MAVPKPGTYTYALTGTTQTPLLGLQGPYAAGAVLTVDISPASPVAGGTEVVQRTTSQPDGVVATTRSVWAAAGAVRLASSNVTFSGLSSYDCAYTPPPEVLPSPLTVVTLGEQSWTGPQCSGTLSVAVLDAETVTAAGRTWNAWRVHSVLHYRAQSALDVTMDTTSLLSPDLGTVVTGDAASTGTVAGQHFANHQITSLTSYP